MVFPWFSHGFPMVFPWFSYASPRVLDDVPSPVGLQDRLHDLNFFDGLPQHTEHQHLLGRHPGDHHAVQQDVDGHLRYV